MRLPFLSRALFVALGIIGAADVITQIVGTGMAHRDRSVTIQQHRGERPRDVVPRAPLEGIDDRDLVTRLEEVRPRQADLVEVRRDRVEVARRDAPLDPRAVALRQLRRQRHDRATIRCRVVQHEQQRVPLPAEPVQAHAHGQITAEREALLRGLGKRRVEIPLGELLLPRFETPDGSEPEEMLRRLASEGLRRRYGDPPPAEAVERLEMELGVIERMGFPSYFLIVWDFVRFAKESGVAVGPGRGSAAGSIVAYALNITDLDPIANDLLFERFLNPARKSMPDIDIDFSVRGRERVMQYVINKYGRESVAQIITFGKMFPRAATRDRSGCRAIGSSSCSTSS